MSLVILGMSSSPPSSCSENIICDVIEHHKTLEPKYDGKTKKCWKNMYSWFMCDNCIVFLYSSCVIVAECVPYSATAKQNVTWNMYFALIAILTMFRSAFDNLKRGYTSVEATFKPSALDYVTRYWPVYTYITPTSIRPNFPLLWRWSYGSPFLILICYPCPIMPKCISALVFKFMFP